jgi:lipoate-protein ligase B
LKRVLLVELPVTDYGESLRIQNSIVERKILREGPDVLFLLQHPPTVTLGKRGDKSQLRCSGEELEARGIELYQVDRGGGATYHGPGQLVGYPILCLRSLNLRIKDYIQRLEETLVRTLQCFGVHSFRRPGRPGVWTSESDKIASIGVRIRRGITSHGFSLNINMPFDPLTLIIACGMPDVRMSNLSWLVDRPVEMSSIRIALSRSFSEVFDVVVERSSLQTVLECAPPQSF